MRIAKTISITLPPDLLSQAQQLAQREHRTMSELFREALRSYTAEKSSAAWKRFEKLAEEGRAHGRAMGIHSEEDVDRILGELRTPGLG